MVNGTLSGSVSGVLSGVNFTTSFTVSTTDTNAQTVLDNIKAFYTNNGATGVTAQASFNPQTTSLS